MFLTPEFAEKVLMRISSNFDNMDMQNANTVIRLLSDTDSIPTNLGMKRPSESYFQPIELFPDLPIKSPHLLVSKHFLLSLGVRESVDVAFVLKLLTDPDPQLKWNTVDVIKYLTANQSKFKSTDWLTLRTSSFLKQMMETYTGHRSYTHQMTNSKRLGCCVLSGSIGMSLPRIKTNFGVRAET